MPSPFPGMDPYLENVNRWRSFHANFITELTFYLNERLPEAFVARSEARCYVLPQHELIYPDALVIRNPSEPQQTVADSGRVATSSRTSPLVLEFTADNIEEWYIDIISADEEEHVVTVIELLSPSNKIRESTGRDEYVQKQRETMRSRAHLLEIDLLRAGQHTVAVPYGALAARARFDYLVSLRRTGNREEKIERYEVWPFTLREPLPTILVPLADGWPDVEADLQEAFDRVYEKARLRQQINYQAEPEPPFMHGDVEWADALLREKSKRL
jgi:hypothetical protein